MKKNIALFLILSLLTLQLPMLTAQAEDADARDALSMNMRSTIAASINEAKVYNNSLTAAQAKGLQVISGKSTAWTNINYTSIAENSDWVGFSEELKEDSGRGYVNYRDFSAIADNAAVVYTVKAAETVDLSNLYFTAHSLNGAITGISADSYIQIDKNSNGTADVKEDFITVQIPLSDFSGTGVCNFTSQTFDTEKFSGLGIVRKKVDNAPASSGKINFLAMKIVNIPTPSGLETAVQSGIKLSFTKPAIDTLDKFEIVRTDDSLNSETFELTSDDLTIENGKYVYIDRTAEVEVTYKYKIRVHESEYNLYSSYSNEVSGEISEDDGGEDLPPADVTGTIVWNPDFRDFQWDSFRPAYSTPGTLGGATQDNYSAASIPGMGTGQIIRFDLNPSLFKEYSTYDEPGMWQIKVYRGYMCGGMYYAEAKGGDNGDQRTSYNINAIKNTGYAIFQIKIDENVPLENLYFAMGDSGSDGSHADSVNYVAVPVLDYMTNDQRGTTQVIAIPLTDFTLSNPHVFQNMRNNEWASANTPDVVQELDWKAVRGMGFIRRVRDGNNDESDPKFNTPEYTNGYIYCGNGFVTNVAPATNFRIHDVKSDKITLKWDHTADAAVKYNVYRTDGDGARQLLGETTKNQYVDYYQGGSFPVGVNFKYEVEAVDSYGTKSPMQSDETLIRSIDHPRKFKAASLQSATSALEVNISWEAPLFGDLKEYKLYRNGSLYQTFEPSVLSYKDTSLVEHSDYTYTMVAVDNNGSESINVNPITVTASCLGMPKNLGYEVKNSNQVELSYNAPDYAEKYYIYLNGEKIGETTDVVYNALDIAYDTALTFGVRAVNAVGALSNESQTSQFVIKNPNLQSQMIIYGDALDPSLTKQPSAGVSISETTQKAIIGNKSLVFDFTTRKASTIPATLSGKVNVKDYRDNGGRLGFWLFADENTDFSKLEVGLSTTGSVAGTNTSMYSTVKASDYVNAINKWVYVEIPLQDLPDYASGTANGLTQSAPIDFAAAKGFSINYNNSLQETGPVIYIDQMTIDTAASWTVSGVRDDSGNQLAQTLSAGAKALNISFTDDMNPDTLKVNGITLSYLDGEETKYVNCYGSYNTATRTYTMNFLEALKQNTAYKLTVSGAASNMGMGGSYTAVYTTNADTPATIDYTVPGITAVMSHSTSGAVTTVTVSMPAGRSETVKNYNLRLNYNSNVIRLNGDSAVADIPAGASVTKEMGVITVSGTMDGNNLSGTIMSVQFTPVNTGTASVSLSGTAEVYNAAADGVASAAISGTDTFSTSVYKPAGGNSDGNSGGNAGGDNAAGRENSNITDIVSPNPTTRPDIGTGASFTDVDDVAWAKDAINYLADNGYIDGYDDGTFKPNNTITREEFAKMIVNVLEFTNYNVESQDFADVDPDAWYAPFVKVAAGTGLVNGVDENNFGTGINISRQDMCVMIYRAIKSENIRTKTLYDDMQFEDQASDYAQEAIRYLYRYGLVNGVGDNRFDPLGNVTRAMAAKVLYGLAAML